MITSVPGLRHARLSATGAVLAVAALVVAGAGFATGASASAPGVFTITSVTSGDGQLNVAWTIPTEPGQTVGIYHVTLVDHNTGDVVDSDDFEVSSNVSPTQTVTGLFNGDPYQVSVQAVFANNWGSAQAENNGVITAVPNGQVAPPPGAVPNAPTDVTAAACWCEWGDATVTWNNAPNGYRSNIFYTFSWIDATDPGGNGSEPAYGDTVETPLTTGDSYTFFVTGTNAAGTGPASAPSGSIIPYTVPDPPTEVRVAARDRSADINWIAPASDGFSAIADYVIAYHDTSDPSGRGDGSLKTSATATHAVVPRLVNGHSYTFTVQVEVAGVFWGKGWDFQAAIQADETSAPSSPTLVAATPDSPAGVRTTSAGPAAITVSWTAPAYDGGAAISGYRVLELDRTTHTTRTTGFGPTARSTAVTGLTGGHQYSFTVLAVNSTGLSKPSTPASVTIPAPFALVSSTLPVALTAGLKPTRAAFTLHLNRPVAVAVSLLHGSTVIATTTLPAGGRTVTGAVPIHLSGTGPLGADTWVTREAATRRVLGQKTVSIKQTSALRLNGTRAGKTVILTGLATWASLKRHAVLPWAGRTVLVQRRTAHGWRTIRVLRTNRAGDITLKLPTGLHGQCRLLDNGTPTIAGAISPTVTP